VGEKSGEEVDVSRDFHQLIGWLHGKAVFRLSFSSTAVSNDNLAVGRATDCEVCLVVSHRRNKRVVSINPQDYSTIASVID
jgi:hypothetical protein